MLIAGSALKGYAIEASDGRIGTVKTFLFDDTTWKIRWLVVDTGYWLTDRQVLVHPSAIGLPDHERQHLPVNLTKAQVEASPDIEQDQPVTMQMQNHLYSYYGWDPYWGPDYYGSGLSGIGASGIGMPFFGQGAVVDTDTLQRGSEDGDPHLRSMNAVRGYHIHATDGSIGHVENFLIDDMTWAIRYLIVDTRNWWPGAHVLISPYAVDSIGWSENQVRLNVSREMVKSSPPWDPVAVVEQLYEHRLHKHYGWPG
ncbi:MAG: PRC-barrel domain containing protein [Janthinobacterium lividum]